MTGRQVVRQSGRQEKSMLSRIVSVMCLTLLPVVAAAQAPAKVGVLLLAHGGSAQWNERVLDVAKRVDDSRPAEVAFGMATRANIQAAIDKLTARGVTEIVAVPLFVSSHSSVITSTEFLLGLRKDAPRDLAIFAKMNHGSPGAPAAEDHSAHAGHAPAADGASPVTITVPIRMTPALNRHPLIGAIAADRARSISTAPEQEAVILVAHGPVPDEDNRLWLEDMAVLAQHVKGSASYASVDYMTVRDDAGPAMREAATKELRDKVSAQIAQGRKVLIVPHLMSFGGIEQGIKKRLEGLDYTMTTQALMPDGRIVQWVLASAQ
jgi:sirohydrochlorin cobaltochelatase